MSIRNYIVVITASLSGIVSIYIDIDITNQYFRTLGIPIPAPLRSRGVTPQIGGVNYLQIVFLPYRVLYHHIFVE